MIGRLPAEKSNFEFKGIIFSSSSENAIQCKIKEISEVVGGNSIIGSNNEFTLFYLVGHSNQTKKSEKVFLYFHIFSGSVKCDHIWIRPKEKIEIWTVDVSVYLCVFATFSVLWFLLSHLLETCKLARLESYPSNLENPIPAIWRSSAISALCVKLCLD